MMPRPPLSFDACGGALWLQKKPFFLKGASYFGMESDICVPHGLWGGRDSTTLAAVAQLLRAHGFNLVRVPLAVAAVAHNPVVNRSKMSNEEAFLAAFEGRQVRYLDVLDHMVHELARHEVLVLLDAHVMQPGAAIPSLWYDEEDKQGWCPETVVETVWATLATRYARQWNVLGADLNNEPHGDATWGSGHDTTDWRRAAMRLAKTVLSICPRWLIFVEGVQTTACDAGHEMPCFWGENLQAVAAHPLTLCVDNRLVYCPHTYGPAVSWQPYFHAADFPANMPRVWDTHFGYLKHATDVPLVIGEWGGRYANPKDWSWQKRFAEYAQEIGVSGVVYWCVNPNGGDTDGLLCADWRTPNANAFQLMSRFRGSPLPPPSSSC